MLDKEIRLKLDKLINIAIDESLIDVPSGQRIFYDYYDFSFVIYPDNLFLKPLKFFNNKSKQNEFKPINKHTKNNGSALHNLIALGKLLKPNYFEDYIKEQPDFYLILDYIKTKYPINNEKTEKTLFNLLRFITYYAVNLKSEFDSWKLKDSEYLKNKILDSYKDKDKGIQEWENGTALNNYIKIILSLIKEEFLLIFDNDISNKPVEYCFNQLIEGVLIENKEYNLGEGIKIRKLDTIDIQFKDLLYQYKDKPISILEIKTNEFVKSHCKETESKEFNLRRNDGRKVSKDEMINFIHFCLNNYIINNSLHLLDLSSIFFSGYIFYAKTFGELIFEETQKDKKQDLKEDLKYSLTINDSNIEKFREIISNYGIFDFEARKDKKVAFIQIALDFYKEALTKDTLNKQITYSMLALEALYNTTAEQVSRTLRERISLFLGLLCKIDNDLNPIFIIDNIKKAYEIRSGYVHGSDPNKTTDTELTKKILNYARLSILIFMQLISFEEIENKRNIIIAQETNKDKQKTIKKAPTKDIINNYLIDWALIDKTTYKELQELVLKCLIC